MPAMAIVEDESTELFESRKADHIRLALDERMQTTGASGLDQIRLRHEAFPELDYSDVSTETYLFSNSSKPIASPLFVSSMTAGHGGSLNLNLVMAKVSEKRNWAMGVGSQRRQLTDRSADLEWSKIRKACPRVKFFGNIGLAQLIRSNVDDIRRLADTLEAEAMIVHTNPLQECMQPEGTPQFKGGLRSLEQLARGLGLPVIVKETGCGMSKETLRKLNGLGVAAVDVSGLGGTHWGRIEGGRSKPGDKLHSVAETFGDWGIGTVDSLVSAMELKSESGLDYEVWASGGVRTGLDAAKLSAMGARLVGLAKPIIEAALNGEEALDARMEQLETELKTALFCMGVASIRQLEELQSSTGEKRVWDRIQIRPQAN
jgi:isopentenyl-diphosphate Delta-isomerase